MSTTYPTTPLAPQSFPPAEVRAHERTYHRFLELVRYAVLAHLVGGSFIVLAFFTGAGWVAALVVAGVILGLGVYLIRQLDEGGPAVKVANLVMTTVEEEDHADRIVERAETEPPHVAAVAPQANPPGGYGVGRWIVVVLFALAAAGWLALTLPTLTSMLSFIGG
jgi:hypothetical protein